MIVLTYLHTYILTYLHTYITLLLYLWALRVSFLSHYCDGKTPKLFCNLISMIFSAHSLVSLKMMTMDLIQVSSLLTFDLYICYVLVV